jgi:hypothetical protein
MIIKKMKGVFVKKQENTYNWRNPVHRSTCVLLPAGTVVIHFTSQIFSEWCVRTANFHSQIYMSDSLPIGS